MERVNRGVFETRDPMIKKVANGYFIYPTTVERAYCTDEEIYVFESWKKMIVFLKAQIDKKGTYEN